MVKTGIEWCDATWNPWIGCHKIATGCKNCYMYRDSKRFGFDPTIVRRSKTKFNEPLKWKDPKRIFVCSYSDFWHEDADAWRREASEIIIEANHHIYMILTKRADRMAWWYQDAASDQHHNLQLFNKSMSHIHWGISASTQEELKKNIDYLNGMPGTKFLSIEPMLEPINLDRFRDMRINGVIVGCESGPYRRLFNDQWANWLMQQCQERSIPFFYKQGIDSKTGKLVKMPELDGRVWNQLPEKSYD